MHPTRRRSMCRYETSSSQIHARTKAQLSWGAVVQGDFMEDIGDFILKEWPEITEDDVKYVDKK
jgi:hypothetical protein